MFLQQAGLLTFPIPGYLPIRNYEQWFVVPGTHAAKATRDYSYGDSTGITPVSLLIVFIKDEIRTNCDANI
jgi:hypothetical protein